MPYFGEGSGTAMDVNITPARNVYPGAPGGTTATLAAAGSPDSYASSPAAQTAVATPQVGGTTGLMWWVGILVIVGLMFFAARKTGQAEEFKNLRASTYNVAFITLVAILGFTVLKVVAVRVKGVKLLSGFADVVLAA